MNHAIDDDLVRELSRNIKPSPAISDAGIKAQVQKLWLDWTDEADAEGFTDFYGLQRRAAREVFLAGEVFFRFRPRRSQDGLTVPLQLQMLPSEMLPLSRNEVSPSGNVIRQGIEFDVIGRRVAYHFLRRHPGDMTDPGLIGEVARIPASEICRASGARRFSTPIGRARCATCWAASARPRWMASAVPPRSSSRRGLRWSRSGRTYWPASCAMSQSATRLRNGLRVPRTAHEC